MHTRHFPWWSWALWISLPWSEYSPGEGGTSHIIWHTSPWSNILSDTLNCYGLLGMQWPAGHLQWWRVQDFSWYCCWMLLSVDSFLLFIRIPSFLCVNLYPVVFWVVLFCSSTCCAVNICALLNLMRWKCPRPHSENIWDQNWGGNHLLRWGTVALDGVRGLVRTTMPLSTHICHHHQRRKQWESPQ